MTQVDSVGLFVCIIVIAVYSFLLGYSMGRTREQIRFLGTEGTQRLIDEGRKRYIAIHGPLAPAPKDEREYLRYVNRDA